MSHSWRVDELFLHDLKNLSSAGIGNTREVLSGRLEANEVYGFYIGQNRY